MEAFLSLQILADAGIGKLLTVFGTGSDLQVPSTEFQKSEERTSKLNLP